MLGPLEGRHLRLGQPPAPSCAASASKSASRFGIVCKSCRSQMHRTPAGETRTPSLANSFAIRTCPTRVLDRQRNDPLLNLRRDAIRENSVSVA